jgi:hypothetical protein
MRSDLRGRGRRVRRAASCDPRTFLILAFLYRIAYPSLSSALEAQRYVPKLRIGRRGGSLKHGERAVWGVEGADLRGRGPRARRAASCDPRTLFGVYGLGLGFGVWGLGFGVWVWGVGFGVWGLKFGV